MKEMFMRKAAFQLCGFLGIVLMSFVTSAAPYAFTITCDEPARYRRCGEETKFMIDCKDLATTNGFGGTVEVWLDDYGTNVCLRRTVDPAKENPIILRGKLNRPGFLRAVAMNPSIKPTFLSLGKGNACYGVGYEPTGIVQGMPRPKDFDAYWQGERARLAREVPLDVRREEVKDFTRKNFRCWKVSFATFNGKRVWGFLTMPEGVKGKLPLRVNVPGAGPASIAKTAAAKTNAVCLTLNVHPYEPAETMEGQKMLYEAQDHEKKAKYGTTYAGSGVGVSREECFFHDPILGMDRAVDWAASLPEVDRSRVWYWGGSQGGGFGMYLMGLNKSFTRGYVWICALADHGGGTVGRIPGWPRMVESNRKNRTTAEYVSSYFDACNFAARIRIPVRMSAGLSDCCCPPPTVYAAYNALGSADKAIVPCPGVGHSIPADVAGEFECWLASDTGEKGVASAELRRYWRMITGEENPPPVRLSVDASVSRSGNDAYVIRSVGNGAEIVGSNGRSLLYGVYDLLGRRGGCRWFWDDDYVPKQKRIDLSGLDAHEESRYAYRGLRYFAHRGLTRFQAEHWGLEDWKREIDWMVKNRLNLFMLRIGQDDVFQRAFPGVCAYPDASRALPGHGKGYDNRTLFWPLEFRGKLRQKVMAYAAERGLMSPEDFGTMTHWYSRTPQDFLEKMSPPFITQASSGYAEKSGLVWDIRRPEWLDAYWKLTDTALSAYDGGRDGLLHTIGVGERHFSENRTTNFAIKVDLNRRLIDSARTRHPHSKVLLAGWDFYSTWKADEVSRFLRTLDPNQVIVWDYAADSYTTGCGGWGDTDFTQWDVIGKFPYSFGIFLCYESGLDIRADYARIRFRQKLVENDPMCKAYILWPEASHTDIFASDYFVRNAWAPCAISEDRRLSEFCRSRYGDQAEAFAAVWREVLPISTNAVRGLWRTNYGLPLVKFSVEQWKDADDAGWRVASPTAFACASSVFSRLAQMDLSSDSARRDAVDLARTVGDRLTLNAEHRMMNAYFRWRGGEEFAVTEFESAATAAVEYAELMARLLAQHTDYSLNDSLRRLNAVERVRNPEFGQVLLENAVNDYSASHHYEAAAHLYPKIIAVLAQAVRVKISAADRTPLEDDVRRSILEDFLKTPLSEMDAHEVRKEGNLKAVFHDFGKMVK